MTTHHPPDKKLEVNGDTPVPKRSLFQRLGAIFLIVALLAAGIFTARHLVRTKPKAEKKPPQKMQTLVRVELLQKKDIQLVIEAMGTVIPARQVDITPEVTGTVVSISDHLIPGGLVKQNDVLLSLDGRDYQFALTRSESALKNAEMDLTLERGHQSVAKREWQLLKDVSDHIEQEAEAALALREPQLAKIEAQVAASRADVDQAKLNMDRTRISAPFNAVVITKDIDVGARVSSQLKIANLVGTDRFWVQLSIERSALKNIVLPDNDGTPGSFVTLQEASDKNGSQERPARLLRLLGDLEPNGLMARLLVAVDDPLSLASAHPPLLLGSFVKAALHGKTLSQVFKVPRTSILPGNTVLLATDTNTMTIRKVTPLWRDSDWVYVREGLTDGERLIVSPVASPVEGMPLNIAGQTSIAPSQMRPQEHE